MCEVYKILLRANCHEESVIFVRAKIVCVKSRVNDEFDAHYILSP